MKTFITGATGFVGRHLTAKLLKDGHDVKCLVRNLDSEGPGCLKGMGAELAVSDVLDADALAGAAKGCDAFIHLVGIIFERRGSTFEDIHFRGTLNALAAAAVAGAGHFVHMSALGTGPDARSSYHQTKWRAEEAVRASGIGYTIFRPSMIYGAGGEFIEMLIGQVRKLPVVPVIGNGRYKMQPILVDDVAACFSAALDNPEALNETLEIGGPDQLTYNEMVDEVGRAVGKPRHKLHVPVTLVWLVAWMSEGVQSKPLLTTDQLRMLLVDNVCDIREMRRAFGIEPVAFSDGLKSIF